MDQIDPRQRLRRRPGQQFGGVAGVEPDIADVVGFDLRQDLRHAVDIGLAADEPDLGKCLRFGDQMLAAAKSDFQPDGIGLRLESSVRSSGADVPISSARCGSRLSIRSAWWMRSLWPLRRPKNEPCEWATRRHPAAHRDRRSRAEAIIAASGTAGAAAAPAARSRRCTSARNGYARPCRRPRGRRALRYAAR